MGNSAAREHSQRLTVERRFDAPPHEVFAAWTDAEQLARWFAPLGYAVTDVQLDLVVGGAYRIMLRAPDGPVIRHAGRYVDISPPTRLAFTWILDGTGCCDSDIDHIDTLVNIEFEALQGATRVVLTHERLPDPNTREGHAIGWQTCMDGLAGYLTHTTA